MERTVIFTFNGDLRVEQSELTDFSTEVASFMKDQLGYETVDVYVVGVRGRYGHKGYVAHL